MKDKNIVQKEMDLIDWFWNRGWCAMKGDILGMSQMDHSYIIAMKAGRVILLNIQDLESGNSKKRVHDIAHEINKMVGIIDPPGMMDDLDIVAGFAISKGWSDMWYFAGSDNPVLSYKQDHTPLQEVVHG